MRYSNANQVLKSGNLDDDYLARILSFTLVTLRKLSSPASEDKLRNRHEQLLGELTEICRAVDASKNAHAVAMTRGLRFALEEIQVHIHDLLCAFLLYRKFYP